MAFTIHQVALQKNMCQFPPLFPILSRTLTSNNPFIAVSLVGKDNVSFGNICLFIGLL